MIMKFLLAVRIATSSNLLFIFKVFVSNHDTNCRQKTLDDILAPWVPAFTKSGLTDYIVELIVFEDEVKSLSTSILALQLINLHRLFN